MSWSNRLPSMYIVAKNFPHSSGNMQTSYLLAQAKGFIMYSTAPINTNSANTLPSGQDEDISIVIWNLDVAENGEGRSKQNILITIATQSPIAWIQDELWIFGVTNLQVDAIADVSIRQIWHRGAWSPRHLTGFSNLRDIKSNFSEKHSAAEFSRKCAALWQLRLRPSLASLEVSPEC